MRGVLRGRRRGVVALRPATKARKHEVISSLFSCFRDFVATRKPKFALASAVFLYLLPAVEPSLDLLLEATVFRRVVLSIGESGRQARHVGNGVGFVVRVLVTLAVVQILHQFGRRVSQMQRYRLGDVAVGV